MLAVHYYNVLFILILMIICISASDHHINKRQAQLANVCNYNQCKYGTCEVTSLTTYSCHCISGITGTNCDTRSTSISPCSSNPCYGNSTCLALSTTSFQCVCGIGPGGLLAGPLCQSIYSCQCLNNGVCQASTDSAGLAIYRCQCPTGYGGNLCQFQISAFQSCQLVGCSNGGTCTILSTCICPQFFTGPLCQTSTLTTTTLATVPKLNLCSTGICQNGGTCFQVTNSLATCVCINGYSGLYCNISPNTISQNVFCASNPCLNAATCVPTDTINGKCACSPLYTGINCNIGLVCNPNPCLNNAQCVTVNGVSTCFCTGTQVPPFCS